MHKADVKKMSFNDITKKLKDITMLLSHQNKKLANEKFCQLR
jgi:hypothetical protein